MINPGFGIYLVMRDHGRLGIEGICHPEKNRQNIIDEIATDHDNITHIYELADGLCIDVTAEFIEAAGIIDPPFSDLPGIDSADVAKHRDQSREERAEEFEGVR